MLPAFLTHYYHDAPFQSITDLPTAEMVRVVAKMSATRSLPRRLLKPIYFMERRRYERKMREQFIAKGGKPRRRNPHYMVLGESDIWEREQPHLIRVPLADIPSEQISFTYTDSWYCYVAFDLHRRPVLRKRQYEIVYRLEELGGLIDEYGWPGSRRDVDPDCRHDFYLEAQVWADEPLLPFKPKT